MMFLALNSNATGATSTTGSTYHSGAPGLTPDFVRFVIDD